MTEIEQQLAAAHEALTAGAWIIARDSFRAALDEEESPEALSGLANALWWLGDMGEAVAHRERSHAEFRLCFYHPTRGRLFPIGRGGATTLNDRTEQEGFTVGYDTGIVGSRVRVLVGVGASLATITTDVIGNWPPLAFWAEEIHG